MTIAEILNLARSAADAGGLPVDEQIGRVERFIEELGAWLDANSSTLDRLTDSDKVQLSEIAALHKQLMLRLGELSAQTSREMGGLKKRSKAIFAYLDRFPRSISLIRNEKG